LDCVDLGPQELIVTAATIKEKYRVFISDKLLLKDVTFPKSHLWVPLSTPFTVKTTLFENLFNEILHLPPLIVNLPWQTNQSDQLQQSFFRGHWKLTLPGDSIADHLVPASGLFHHFQSGIFQMSRNLWPEADLGHKMSELHTCQA
jgi:hypothetical protein